MGPIRVKLFPSRELLQDEAYRNIGHRLAPENEEQQWIHLLLPIQFQQNPDFKSTYLLSNQNFTIDDSLRVPNVKKGIM